MTRAGTRVKVLPNKLSLILTRKGVTDKWTLT